MSSPIRPDFWNIVRPVLKPARIAGRSYIDAGRYVERTDPRPYEESGTGWPLVWGKDWSQSGNPRWRTLFSVKDGPLSRLLVQDVPELEAGMQEAVSLAERDPGFAIGLDLDHRVQDPDRRIFYAETEFLSMIGDILGRAEALVIQDDQGLRDLYLQVERGRFAKELSGDIVIPLVLTAFEAQEPVQLVGDYWLEPLSEATQRSRAPGSGYSNDAVSPLITAAATHAIVQRNVTFPNTMWPPASLAGADPLPVPLDSVHRILESIHIISGKKTGYSQVLVRSDRWVSWSGWNGDLPHLWKAQTSKHYPDSFNGGWLRPKDHISMIEIGEIKAVITSLMDSPKNVRLAARRCFRSTFREDIEDEILDATIGIEALLSHGRDELTHRMSQRAAAALAEDFQANAIYELLKQVYAQRSQIVHGNTPKNSKVRFDEHDFWTNHMGVFLLRNLLRNNLLAREPWTASSLDALILQRIGKFEDGEGS